MTRYLKAFPLVVTLLTGLFILTDAHAAVFQLMVTPRRGGQTIRFEGAQPGGILRNEEVMVTINTDRNAQYRVYQTLYQPLTNEFGNTIPQNAFIVFSPSNPAGTLRTQLETPIAMGQFPVYVSNAAGSAEEFVLVYNVRVPENQPGGIYRTQLTLTAELLNPQGGFASSSVTVDVRVEINPTFRLTLQNQKGSRSLDLGRITKESPVASDALKVAIESNTGTTYRIFQQLSEPLISSDGTMLNEEDLLVSVIGAAKGVSAIGPTPMPVTQSQTLLYTSSDSGAADALVIQYQLKSDAMPKAGIYSGSLSFKVESKSPFVPSEPIRVPVRIEIDTIFYLDTEVQKGSSLSFGVFKKPGEKHEKQVLLTVHSNLGQPYQVTQIMPRKLVSETGNVIDKENFTFFGVEAQTGVLAIMSPKAVPEGESVVFTSDKKGTPEKFLLNYVLTLPKDARSGSYASEVKYSITTL